MVTQLRAWEIVHNESRDISDVVVNQILASVESAWPIM